MLIFDNEDHVKSGQDGGHEVNVLPALGVVPPAKHGVGGRQHGAARVEGGGDARLGEGVSCCFLFIKIK